MARRNFYTNPGVVREDFGAFARGVASTFRPAKRAEFKEVDLQAFDPVERNAFYEVDGVKYDINEDAFLLANERFVDVINTQRDEFQRAHGDKKAQARIQKDMLGYNDVNKFGAAFEALENVEEFDSNLQFFFPDENGNATNISAGELGKILSSNANALTVAKKQNKNGITHYGYEVQTGSGKVFLSGTSINEDYLSSNLKQSYNQTSIVDALAKKYRGNRKTLAVKASDGNTYISPDSIKMDSFDAMRVANEVFNTNSNYSEMFPSAQRKYNQAIKNGEFVSANPEASDLDKMKEYISQEYLLRSAPDAYVRSEGVEGYPKGYAIPLTEANKNLFTTGAGGTKQGRGSGGSGGGGGIISDLTASKLLNASKFGSLDSNTMVDVYESLINENLNTKEQIIERLNQDLEATVGRLDKEEIQLQIDKINQYNDGDLFTGDLGDITSIKPLANFNNLKGTKSAINIDDAILVLASDMNQTQRNNFEKSLAKLLPGKIKEYNKNIAEFNKQKTPSRAEVLGLINTYQASQLGTE